MQNTNSYRERHGLSLHRKRGIALGLCVSVLVFLIACHSQVHSEIRPPGKEAPAATPAPRDVASLCESIKDIEVLPHKGEPVPDPAYNALVSVGDQAIPCLIRKITDEMVMNDPRSAPKVGNVLVGDTAFFVFVDIAKIDQSGFVELLPPDVRKAYEGEQGVYGYFSRINEDGNRAKLQDAAVKWYEKKYGHSMP